MKPQILEVVLVNYFQTWFSKSRFGAFSSFGFLQCILRNQKQQQTNLISTTSTQKGTVAMVCQNVSIFGGIHKGFGTIQFFYFFRAIATLMGFWP
jgi:hypothetical protein